MDVKKLMENLLYKLQLQVSHSYLSEGGPTINLKFIYLFIYLSFIVKLYHLVPKCWIIILFFNFHFGN
jgi:hypothetical protein